ncbi:MAG: ROK family protein [Verrucomicrobiota bacterium]
MTADKIATVDGLFGGALRHVPELDPGFLPASIWLREFEGLIRQQGGRKVHIDLHRPNGEVSHHSTKLLPASPEWESLNFHQLERTIKFLLWSHGGSRVGLSGASDLCAPLSKCFSSDGPRAFDAEFFRRVFGEELRVEDLGESAGGASGEFEGGASKPGDASGCRIGFDLGGSDRKCAAVIDGEVVFSEEVVWDPYFQSDPSYHFEGIMDSLRRAAEHLPRVDAIGGSAAGVYVDNEVKVASLFRGVPDELFESRVKHIFRDIAREWGDVPFKVVNDGDVTALAGSIALQDGAVLGLAMGTSAAAGYVDSAGRITNRLSELAFVPVDYREGGPVDEWSGDRGCAVQYFSQQAVSRLIPASGLEIDEHLDKPDKLIEVQHFMEKGDERAAAIYRSIGTYLGYAIPQFARFYDLRHLLLLGRVLSGDGGGMIIEKAETVLHDEFPELHGAVKIGTPDEKTKRHGQAIAAASLPELP